MLKDTSKNIYGELELMPLTLLGKKLRVGIIGGGQGALIKAKSFLRNGSCVEVIALDFNEKFYFLENIKLNKVNYNKEFILDKHIIVIAIDDRDMTKTIINDCEELSKIYINSTNFKDGIGIIPVSKKTKSVTIAVNTNEGNPKAAVMVAEYLIDELKPMDEFIGFTSIIRNKLQIDKVLKREILTFINTLDFKYFYEKDKYYNVLSMFYKDEIVETIKNLK